MGAQRTPDAPHKQDWGDWPCDLTPGAPDKDGYGRVRVAGRQVRAHRQAWMDQKGSIPSEVQVLHHCDVRSCRRIQHLWIGNNADNMKDRDEKGRGVPPPSARGVCRDLAPRTKLDTSIRRVIIARIESGESKIVVSAGFGVHVKTIASIWRNRANDGWRK